ncbi:MAG: bifunctional phosphoribosylaminoimidazolecarboxamide formyltransferase/IMP cyclohydrolase [Candidatus Omnitrophica bacterium]|nr:bifunctional phosphoribosylaminoimidazolecarboxamide formyltransferase/IMP cyclohydrolase [Candidatus Omnitrophota bacterium]
MKSIRRALISVSDKSGLVPFAKVLHKQKVQILSTGGTLKVLEEAKIPAQAVESLTGFPEVFEGRVKTLHPKIHGGLLYRRDKESHVEQAVKLGIEPIDMVVVNLYPFEKVTCDPKVEFEDAIENIDIGGPSMLRSAAKNHQDVVVICDPEDYVKVADEMKENEGAVSDALRQALALKVFERTSAYDKAIACFLMNRQKGPEHEGKAAALPDKWQDDYVKVQDLRYGENPHQQAAFYAPGKEKCGLPFKQLHGKELSFNNLLDIDATIGVIREFEEPAACVIKHSNPCGVAENENLVKALENAIECDAMSAFGGIIGINRSCTSQVAQMAMDKLHFFEVFVAPSFQPAAQKLLQQRKNLRLIATEEMTETASYDARYLQYGLLLQTRDIPMCRQMDEIKQQLRFVTKIKLADDEIDDLLFAMKCAKVVKSNAIVITQGRQTVGIGAGQMSRIDAVELACRKAGYRTEDGILASDAFFPMPDSIEVARDRKIKAIIQPGGSLRDEEVIAACDQFKIAMAFTGKRHFRH